MVNAFVVYPAVIALFLRHKPHRRGPSETSQTRYRISISVQGQLAVGPFLRKPVEPLGEKKGDLTVWRGDDNIFVSIAEWLVLCCAVSQAKIKLQRVL